MVVRETNNMAVTATSTKVGFLASALTTLSNLPAILSSLGLLAIVPATFIPYVGLATGLASLITHFIQSKKDTAATPVA